MLRKLASHTALYGLSSMLGRFINFLLVIPHTKYLNSVSSFGDVTAIFAFIAFMNIILTYGMETGFFYFIRQGMDKAKVYSHAQVSLLVSTSLFAIIILIFAGDAASLMGFPGHTEYVYCCLIFLVFDTLSALPFARLRIEEKPLSFASVKLLNILVNVSLNIFFLTNTPAFLKSYNQVTLILIASACASLCSFLVLSPIAFKVRGHFESSFIRKILSYTWPLIFVGLAGIVNETLDRTLLLRLLPNDEGSYQNGIYGAFYKLTMVMTMFVQAYRFAAEPLFFKQSETDSSRLNYSRAMYWFIAICSLIFLLTMYFIDFLSHLFIKNEDYFKDENGLSIVPVLLLANLFLGIYYNLSIWYRFTGRTGLGALITGSAAVLTIVLNLWLIPYYGFTACAWITLLAYASMTLASYFIGNHYYPVPYHPLRYSLLILTSLLLWQASVQLECHFKVKPYLWLINLLFAAFMLLIIWKLQPKVKND